MPARPGVSAFRQPLVTTACGERIVATLTTKDDNRVRCPYCRAGVPWGTAPPTAQEGQPMPFIPGPVCEAWEPTVDASCQHNSCWGIMCLNGSNLGLWWRPGRAPAAPPAACPPSAVVDQIVRWDEVRDGDLVLWAGELRLVDRWTLSSVCPDLHVAVMLAGNDRR